MKCPTCDGDVEMMVDVTMLIPAEMESNLTKMSLRDKRVSLYAANWGRASYFCRNSDCGWVMRPPIPPELLDIPELEENEEIATLKNALRKVKFELKMLQGEL